MNKFIEAGLLNRGSYYGLTKEAGLRKTDN